jgi:hypothetical protein
LTNKAVNGVNSTTVTGNKFIPKTPEVFSYDLDGNLTAMAAGPTPGMLKTG